MIEIRSTGDAADVDKAKALIRRIFQVTETSGPYVNRRGASVRIYLAAAGPARAQDNEHSMRRRHELRKADGRWMCAVCRWQWKSQPASRCPGLPGYTWETAEGQEPAGVVLSGDGRQYYDLYERAAAAEKRKMTLAQERATLANLEKARQALTCIDCGERFADKWELDEDGRCDDCAHLHYVAEAGRKAREELGALATAGDYLILDLETTGLDGDAEIVQIGIVDAAGKVIMDQLVKPAGSIPAAATAGKGITAADVAGAPPFPAVYEELASIVNSRCLVAYNADFETRVLEQVCERHELPLPAVGEWTCAMRLFSAYRGEWSDYYRDFRLVSLCVACREMDVDRDGAQMHSAAGDALLTWRLLQRFRREPA